MSWLGARLYRVALVVSLLLLLAPWWLSEALPMVTAPGVPLLPLRWGASLAIVALAGACLAVLWAFERSRWLIFLALPMCASGVLARGELSVQLALAVGLVGLAVGRLGWAQWTRGERAAGAGRVGAGFLIAAIGALVWSAGGDRVVPGHRLGGEALWGYVFGDLLSPTGSGRDLTLLTVTLGGWLTLMGTSRRTSGGLVAVAGLLLAGGLSLALLGAEGAAGPGGHLCWSALLVLMLAPEPALGPGQWLGRGAVAAGVSGAVFFAGHVGTKVLYWQSAEVAPLSGLLEQVTGEGPVICRHEPVGRRHYHRVGGTEICAQLLAERGVAQIAGPKRLTRGALAQAGVSHVIVGGEPDLPVGAAVGVGATTRGPASPSGWHLLRPIPLPPPRIVTVLAAGRTEGTPLSWRCPNATRLSGVTVSLTRDAERVASLQGRCRREVSGDAEGKGKAAEVSGRRFGARAGQGATTLSCPPGAEIVGLAGRHSAALRRLAPICGDGATKTWIAGDVAGWDADALEPWELRCPQGTRPQRLVVWARAVIHAVGIHCEPPSP